ncbi:5-oxoprolinase-like protein [Tanacetum coccineum]
MIVLQCFQLGFFLGKSSFGNFYERTVARGFELTGIGFCGKRGYQNQRTNLSNARYMLLLEVPTYFKFSFSLQELIKSSFQDIVSDELKKMKETPMKSCSETLSADAETNDDMIWEYDGLHEAYQGECEEIMLEMQKIFYEDLENEQIGKDSNINAWEDEEDEYLARAVFENMQLNDDKVGKEVTLEILRDRLAEAHGQHFDRGCRLKPKFCIKSKFDMTALYMECQGCNTFEIGGRDLYKVYKEAGNVAVMSISVDDCIDLDGMERSILAKVKDLSVISELLKHMSSEGFDDVGLRYVGGRWVWLEFDSMDQVESVKTSKALKEIFLEFKDVSHDFIPDERCVWIDLVGLPLASWAPEVYKKLGGRWGSSVFTDMVSNGPMSHGKVCVLTESLHRVIESFIVSYRNRTYRIIATEFAYWAPNIESMEVNSESNPLERKDAEGPSLDESLENEEHLDSAFCREEDVAWGGKMILWTPLKKGVRDDSVLYNDGCIKDCMENNLEDDAGEILGVHSQGDCGNVTTDDNEDVMPVIAPEKDSIIAPPSTPPGNDLNIAVESGSSWIDYIGHLTSDEIDSDKRWSYRDPNGNIHGLFSLAQLRSWKDYFPSDLQIWSYYGNVKEAILLHNALSRQTKDAG